MAKSALPALQIFLLLVNLPLDLCFSTAQDFIVSLASLFTLNLVLEEI